MPALKRVSDGWLAVLVACFVCVSTTVTADQKPQTKPKPRPAPTKQRATPEKPPAKAPAPVAPQWKAVTRYVSGTSENIVTLYATADRQRVELGTDTAVITQCDTQSVIQINSKARGYTRAPLVSSSTPVPSHPPAKPAGVVVVRTVATDTGERREILGRAAHRVRMVTTTEPGAGACDRRKGRVESDGWYAELAGMPVCALGKQAPAPSDDDCEDERRIETTGNVSPGYPLSYTLVTFDDRDKETSRLTVEATSLTREPQVPALYQAPADYSEMPNAAAMTAAVRKVELEELGTTPKAAGMIRIGVIAPVDSSGRGLTADAMAEELWDALDEKPYEAVLILAQTLDEQHVEAAKKECDYILRTELTQVTSSKPRRVGALVRRASGAGTATELHEAKVNVELIAVGEKTPRVKESASAKTGEFTWRRPVGLARFAGRIYFGLTAGVTHAVMACAGGGGMMSAADPMLNAFNSVLDRFTAPADEYTPESAIAAAFGRGATEIKEALKRKSEKK